MEIIVDYESPHVEIIEVAIEQGFNMSMPYDEGGFVQ